MNSVVASSDEAGVSVSPPSGSDSARRRGLFVALVGPDGAGKTTLAHSLSTDPSLNARSIYMGRNPQVRRTTLPVPAWLRQNRPGMTTSLPPLIAHAAKGLGFCQVLVEQWLCYLAAYRHQRLGGVVLFDRYVSDPDPDAERRSVGQRLRRALLNGGAPRLDLVIVLDASADMLYARKPEHPIARLQRMRASYLGLAEAVPNAVIVDASQDASAVATAVASLIRARIARNIRLQETNAV